MGRLEPRKALSLALEAPAQVRDLPLRLMVAGGDGPLRAEWERLAQRYGLEKRGRLLCFVPWEEMPKLYEDVDLFVFTSLRDSSGAQVLEAAASSLPVLTLDHQGVGAFVPPETRVKVPVTTPGETVAALSAGMRRLAQSPEMRWRMGEAGWAYAQTQSWKNRAEQMRSWYKKVLEAYPRSGKARQVAKSLVEVGNGQSFPYPDA